MAHIIWFIVALIKDCVFPWFPNLVGCFPGHSLPGSFFSVCCPCMRKCNWVK